MSVPKVGSIIQRFVNFQPPPEAPEGLPSGTTLEYFGCATFRLKSRGVTIFHDCFLNKPEYERSWLRPEDVKECDYIVFNHAHFDHIPGSIEVAKATGCTLIANAEAIRIFRENGVPEKQLFPVAGGEFIPLKNGIDLRVYPALHTLGGAGSLYTDTQYTGKPGQSPLDISKGLTGAFHTCWNTPLDKLAENPGFISAPFKRWLEKNMGQFSTWDGGCMMYNFIIPGEGNVLFNTHAGAYMGIYSAMDPKPDIAVLGVAGQPCVDGQGYTGSISSFIVDSLKRLGQPKQVTWALSDHVNCDAVIKAVSTETSTKPLWLEPATPQKIF